MNKTLKHASEICLKVFLILVLLFFGFKKNLSLVKPKIIINKQDSSLNINHEFLKVISLGQTRLVSSVLWITTLMNSDIKHYKKNDLRSWLYLRFKTIAHLDPRFYQVFLWGGQYLSVIKDDTLGAEELYKLSEKYFKNDFWINYYRAFNAYFELGDIVSAIRYYDRIIDSPLVKKHAPYLPSIVSKLKLYQGGSLETAFLQLKIAYERTRKNPNIKKRYFNQMYAIKAEIDLKCLNLKKDNCSKKDLNGNFYLYDKKNNQYYASKTWRPFRIRIKKKALQK